MSDQSNIPTSFEGVAGTIQQTLLDIWVNFIAHTPYLVGAIIVLIATWGD